MTMYNLPGRVLILATALFGAVKAFEPHSFIKACHDNETEEVMRQVMEDPELVHKVGRRGDTCLRMAAQNDNLFLVLWLMEQGADVNARNTLEPESMPVIGWFIMHTNYEAVERILYLKADPNPVFRAMNRTHDRTGEWFTPLDLVDFIVSHDHFTDGYSQADVFEELPEHHEKYIHMRDRLRVNGAVSYKYLDKDEL